MANKTNPLTNTEVKQAKPREKEYNLIDGKGLALRIRPSGSKIWLFNYVHPYTKKRVNLGFGQYPSVTLAQARSEREKARALLAQNIDPKENKTTESLKVQEAELNTLEHISKHWFDKWKVNISTNHAIDT
jgi:hypothetical protein